MWPDGTQCVVTLTFDIDGPFATLRHNPELATIPASSRWASSIQKWARAASLNCLPATPSRQLSSSPTGSPSATRILCGKSLGHEIAYHGYLHKSPSSLGPDEDEGGILDHGSKILEHVRGSRPRGYRSPPWELSAESLNLLHERGFVYDSSLMGDDVPYFVGESDCVPFGRLRMAIALTYANCVPGAYGYPLAGAGLCGDQVNLLRWPSSGSSVPDRSGTRAKVPSTASRSNRNSAHDTFSVLCSGHVPLYA
jgi:hypothetical protein